MVGLLKAMQEKARLFVAIELPDDVKRELGGLIDALTVSNISGVRCVRPEGIHLTLKFLGDTDIDRIKAIEAALSGAVEGHSPFQLELAQAGAFPNLHRPRVLWVGVGGDLKALGSLQANVESALDAVGLAKERRGYNPHLTLARIRNGAPPSSGRDAADILSKTRTRKNAGIPVNEISLMRTELHPDGAIHQRLVSFPLQSGYLDLI